MYSKLADPNLFVTMKVFLKFKVNCNTVCGAIQDMPWQNIWSADKPVKVLNKHLSLLVGYYMPTKVISVHNKDMLWCDFSIENYIDNLMNAGVIFASSWRLNFAEPMLTLGWTGNYLSKVKCEIMKPTRRPSISLVTGMFLWIPSPLINGHPKSAVFGLSLLLLLLAGGGGGLMCELDRKADLLSDHFDGKQSRESIDLPLNYHPSHSLITSAFRLSEVMHLLLDLDPYGGTVADTMLSTQ